MFNFIILCNAGTRADYSRPGYRPNGYYKPVGRAVTWNPDSTVKNYKTLFGSGGSSLRFLCDVGDKLPAI